MAKVAVLMGSKSDMPTVQYCLDILDEFSIKYIMKVLSAHRTPTETARFAREAHKKGIKVIIAAAGNAAHLAGILASHTTLPVIGIPIENKSLAGNDHSQKIIYSYHLSSEGGDDEKNKNSNDTLGAGCLWRLTS